MPKKSKDKSSKKDRSARKKSGSRSRLSKKKKQSASRSRLSKKQTKLTLEDYDDLQQKLLKRQESIQQKEKKKKQKKAATQIQTATNFPVGHHRTDLLSRKRRFVKTTGWTFKINLNCAIPLEGICSSLSIDLPFTFSFDDGR